MRTTDHPPEPSETANRESTTGPPRWVTVVAIVVGVLVVLGFLVLHLSGAIGPGLHGGG